MRPQHPGPWQEWAGALSILFLIVVIDRASTLAGKMFILAGLIYLIAIIFVACWAGVRAAMVGCAMLVVYAFIVYRFPISVFGREQAKMTQSLISTSILYPVFALSFGLIQAKLRTARIHEYDARMAADEQSQQRRQAEAELGISEEMRKLIVESSLDAIVGVDANGAITTWNPNAEKLFGWTSAEAIGKAIAEVIPNADISTTGLAELTGTTKAGDLVAVELYVATHGTDNGALHILFIRDISERKRAHESIQELNASLEERVTERTAQLEAANRELVGFTYSVSHDLRAPLRAIVANSRIAREELEQVLDKSAMERLHRLELNALKMSELIENLLHFARIGQLALNPRQVDVTALVESIAEDLKASKPGTVKVEPNMVAKGDADMLKMLLRNLIENAWKYVRQGEEPTVEVGKTSDGAFFVRDNGIGFDMRYVDKIWEPFERLHREEDYPGTGIGLANAKRIVERHGGRIWAESNPGEGTTIYFDLNRRRVSERRSVPYVVREA